MAALVPVPSNSQLTTFCHLVNNIFQVQTLNFSNRSWILKSVALLNRSQLTMTFAAQFLLLKMLLPTDPLLSWCAGVLKTVSRESFTGSHKVHSDYTTHKRPAHALHSCWSCNTTLSLAEQQQVQADWLQLPVAPTTTPTHNHRFSLRSPSCP